ncbi:MAG TPA: SMEK domain-containing protein [Steroidobacteraceae bacterium]|nr:SMEK domain-containing protein [Steroidobacteraceae bacterium]
MLIERAQRHWLGRRIKHRHAQITADVKLEDLQHEVRQLINRFRLDVQGAIDMGHEISGATELFLLELFREVYELPSLRSLNEDRPNFPGIDLGDQASGRAFQISASRDLGKIVESLQTVVREGLHETYPHVQVFVATEKQRSYKQDTIDKATDGKLAFDAKKDVLDSGDLLKLFSTFELDRLERVAVILRKHFPGPVAPTMVRALAEALERDLTNRYRQAVQRSTFPENAGADVFAELARDALGQGSEQLSEPLRRRILLRAARSAALTRDVETAERLLAAAIALKGTDTDLPAKARIAEARGDVEGAIRILRDQHDADSISTLLSVLARGRDDAVALAWLADQHVSIGALTSNGALTLVGIYLHGERIDDARRMLDELSDAQLTESPYLLLLRGVVGIASVFSKPDQRLITGGMPLQPGNATPVLPEAQLAARLDAAISDLQRVQSAIRELKLPQTMRVAEAYALWCELLHPHRRANALAQLRRDMLEPAKAVHCVQFAFAFDDEFDPRQLDEWLRRREATVGLDDDELRATLVIRMHGDPAPVAQLIAAHRARFQAIFGEAQALIIEVQALAAAKDATSARVLLNAGKDLLDSVALSRLEVEVAKAEGADPIVEHLRAYEATRTTEALRSLVTALAQQADHRALGQYAELLYAETGDPRDIARAARAFAGAGDYENFLRIMDAFPFLRNRDPQLKRRYAWQLFERGRLQESRRMAEELRADSAVRDLNLEIALAIETGRWEALGVPLATYLDQPEAHDGLTLIRAAHLAYEAGHGPFQQLTEAAVRNSPNDAQVLLGAYTLAMESGLEEIRPEAQDWFRRALELSGPDGPVQKFELKDLLTRQAEWSAHSQTIDDAIIRGEIPLVIGAPALRTTMVEAILGNFERNSGLADPRKRSLIPLFSGRRTPSRIGDIRRVALDISAVLVLGWLGLLPRVLGFFDRVLLPAGLLQDLFQGRRRARASQKSQLLRARHVQDLIGHGLKVLPSSNSAATGLSEEIGVELATLIEAAQANNGVVVHPAPVHRLGLEDVRNVDMSAYASQLTDLHALLDTLKALGAVDQHTELTARRYFDIQAQRWPHPVEPERTQPIYLDGLSIAYLQTTHLLDTVVRAFDNVYVHKSVEDEAAATLDAERRAGEMLHTIDAIREAIGQADAAGKIVFGPRSARADKDELRESSTLHLLSDLLDAEAVIVDDRALNKELIATDGKNHQARAVTTLDVIEELHARGEVTDDERLTLRHRLRVAGAALIAVDSDEIRRAAERNSVHESAEFRAIRESIALARMRKAPRFPSEVPWLVAVALATKGAIQDVWKRSNDTERAASLADAILDIRPNIVEWLSCWEGEPPPLWAEAVVRSMTASLMLPIELTQANVRQAYNEWLEQRILGPMRTLEPERYQEAVSYLKSLILSIARNDDE